MHKNLCAFVNRKTVHLFFFCFCLCTSCDRVRNLNENPGIICSLVGLNSYLQSWPKMSGPFKKSTTKHPLPSPSPPVQCCPVAVFIYSPNDFSSYQHYLGEGRGGGLPKLRNDGITKLKVTGDRFSEHKCTLETLVCYLSLKILARIVATVTPFSVE